MKFKNLIGYGYFVIRLGMQIAKLKQRQILPRVGNQIWVSTPQNRTYRAWENWNYRFKY